MTPAELAAVFADRAESIGLDLNELARELRALITARLDSDEEWTLTVRATEHYRVQARANVSEDGLVATVDVRIQSVRGISWETDAAGFVRWDGCANIGDDGCMLHFCGDAQALEFGHAVRMAYALAHDLMPSADFDRPEVSALMRFDGATFFDGQHPEVRRDR